MRLAQPLSHSTGYVFDSAKFQQRFSKVAIDHQHQFVASYIRRHKKREQVHVPPKKALRCGGVMFVFHSRGRGGCVKTGFATWEQRNQKGANKPQTRASAEEGAPQLALRGSDF